MKTKSQSKLSFVLYEDRYPPRFYSISKTKLRFIIYGLPTLTLISIIILGMGGIYFKHIERLAEKKEPAIIKSLRLDKQQLTSEIAKITTSRDLLQNKLSQGITKTTGLGFLSLFNQSAGRKDLTASPEMKLEEIELSPNSSNVSISFNVVNMTKDESRLTGYIFVVMKGGDNIQVWPKTSFTDSSMLVQFGNGQFFATSRFRPVRADFRKIPGVSNYLFKIVIFSRTGDLIFKQLISKTL